MRCFDIFLKFCWCKELVVFFRIIGLEVEFLFLCNEMKLLMEQFAENARAYVFAMSFLLVTFVLFFVRCLRAVG